MSQNGGDHGPFLHVSFPLPCRPSPRLLLLCTSHTSYTLTAPTTSIVPHPSSSTTKLLSLNLQPATLSPGPSIINLNPLLTQPSINSHHSPLLIPHSSFPIPSSHSPQVCRNSSGARQDRISMRTPHHTHTPLLVRQPRGATQNLSLARRDRL